jgi:rhodanese-related sulfurtransferase
MSAHQAMKLVGQEDVEFIDLREASEREKHGTIPGSLHAPYPDLSANVGSGGLLHRLASKGEKRILFYCAFGERSAMAVQAAQDAGLKSAAHIQGGMDAWKKACGPVER